MRNIVYAVALAVVVVACGTPAATSAPPASPSAAPSAASTPAPTPTPTPTPTATPTPEPTLVRVPSPLTGLLVREATAWRHPIAVMIDDHPDARPQSGLNLASVVWHAPAEGGVPRYMAMYLDRLPDELGPVRSARVYFIGWAAEWRAVYAHSGGSPAALRLLRRRGDGDLVYNADEYRYGGGAFERSRDRFAPHNVYTSGPRMRRLGIRLGAEDGERDPVWTFAPDAPLGERPYGGSIRVPYPWNLVIYRYDRESNRWIRQVTGEKPQVDQNDREPIGPKNVVVMYAQFTNTGDAKGRLDADIVGSGKATISTNGRTITGTWRKESTRRPTQFFDRDGRPVVLTAGQTFIQVVDLGTKVTIRPGSETPPAP